MTLVKGQIRKNACRLQVILCRKEEYQQALRSDIEHLIGINERGYAKKLAEQLGVSPQFLSDFKAGHRDAGKKMIDRLAVLK